VGKRDSNRTEDRIASLSTVFRLDFPLALGNAAMVLVAAMLTF
jgi:hypothetical protein